MRPRLRRQAGFPGKSGYTCSVSCEEIFFQKLREQGFRLTPQREMVLHVMHQLDDFSTAEAIYARVQTMSAAVDLSTVYRTLDLLDRLHMVACVETGDGQRVFKLEGAHGPHLHLVCARCGAVAGAELDAARPLAAALRARHGFAAELDHLTIPGLCAACAAEE